MTTAARVISTNGAHFYLPDGTPYYEVPYADPSKGMRKTTLADARKVNALPSVTNILNILDKPALTAWKVEQGVLAVLTTPRQPGEADDAFVHRVLQVERVQDQEVEKARDMGTAIHDAIERYYTGQEIDPELNKYIAGAIIEVNKLGELVSAEHVLVGHGYAGRTDLILKGPECYWILDFKSCKKLPKKEAYPEHVMQLAAYAAAWLRKFSLAGETAGDVRTANCYISTTEPGKFILIEHDPDWEDAYHAGFKPALALWSFLNDYQPVI